MRKYIQSSPYYDLGESRHRGVDKDQVRNDAFLECMRSAALGILLEGEIPERMEIEVNEEEQGWDYRLIMTIKVYPLE